MTPASPRDKLVDFLSPTFEEVSEALEPVLASAARKTVVVIGSLVLSNLPYL